jgi:hypothetical protein
LAACGTGATAEGAVDRLSGRRVGCGERANPDCFSPESGGNTFFHIAMAYAILRHSGVDVGKMDFLGSIDLVDA